MVHGRDQVAGSRERLREPRGRTVAAAAVREQHQRHARGCGAHRASHAPRPGKMPSHQIVSSLVPGAAGYQTVVARRRPRATSSSSRVVTPTGSRAGSLLLGPHGPRSGDGAKRARAPQPAAQRASRMATATRTGRARASIVTGSPHKPHHLPDVSDAFDPESTTWSRRPARQDMR